MKNKKILITGGAGFIGSNLINKLISNNEIICLDNFITGSNINIQPFKKHKNFSLIKGSILSNIKGKYDFIYNLACPASPYHYQKNPIETFKASVIGSLNILENAYKNDSIVFQASTSEIYGDPLEHPQKENYFGNVSTIGPRACYDEGKRAAETIFFDFKRIYNVKIKLVRIFNTYGPNMSPNDGRVISNFIVQALKNKPITIHGNGDQTRSFCYIDDLVNGIIAYSNIKKNFSGPINLGNNKEYSINQIALKIKKITNSNSKIIYKKKQVDDPHKRKPDINLAKKILKWKATTNLNEGLKKTIDYFNAII